jgi:hypothetical protein
MKKFEKVSEKTKCSLAIGNIMRRVSRRGRKMLFYVCGNFYFSGIGRMSGCGARNAVVVISRTASGLG